MIRMSKLADYGIVLMTQLAEDEESRLSSRELATASHLPFPVVSKILKALAREGLLTSQRGANGGYRLARSPEAISVSEVIVALEGPIAMTECLDAPGDCRTESYCPVRRNWRKIDRAVRRVLDAITLSDMLEPLPDHLVPLGGQETDPSRLSASPGNLSRN